MSDRATAPHSNAGRPNVRLARPEVLAGIVVLTALLLRVGFYLEIRDTALDRWHLFDQTDMATYLTQAEELRTQDWLAVEPHHPYHAPQRIAPEDQWLGWYGPHRFHQAPAYSYALAALGALTEEPLPIVKVLQLVTGAGTCLLIFFLAGRVGGDLAGLAAGLLAAFYGPLLYLEAQILREALAIFGATAILLLLCGFVETAKRPPPRRSVGYALVLGVAIGSFAMFHETSVILFIATAIVVTGRGLVKSWRLAAACVAALLLGYGLGFAPLAARNVAVAAPVLSVSSRTLVNFVTTNEADAATGGAVFAIPSQAAIRILDTSGGSTPKAVAAVWRSYDGDVARLARNWLLRAMVNWQPWEIPDNTSYDFYRETSGVLKVAIDYRWVFAPAFAAILLIWFAAAQGAREARPRDAGALLAPYAAVFERAVGAHAVLLLYLLGISAALSLCHSVGRFRLYLMPVVWVYAGIALAALVELVRRRRWTGVAALVSVAALGAGIQQWSRLVYDDPAPRRSDYRVGLELALANHEAALASRIAELAETRHPDFPDPYFMLGSYWEQVGRPAAAREAYQRALELVPTHEPSLERLRASGL